VSVRPATLGFSELTIGEVDDQANSEDHQSQEQDDFAGIV
jgi:hypothetical protein